MHPNTQIYIKRGKNAELPRGMALVLLNYGIASLTGGIKRNLLALCRPLCGPGTVVDSSPFYDIRLASVGFGRPHQDTGSAKRLEKVTSQGSLTCAPSL